MCLLINNLNGLESKWAEIEMENENNNKLFTLIVRIGIGIGMNYFVINVFTSFCNWNELL